MGKYVNENLGVGEEVLFETHLNYVMLWITLLLLLPMGWCLSSYFFYIFVAIFPILFLYYYLNVKTSEFVVTNRKVFIKYGILSIISLEINLDKIESIGVNQDILGMMFGYGTITVSGTGGTMQFFNYIDNPIDFRKNVSMAIDKYNEDKK